MESKFKLEEETEFIKMNLPNKYLDIELNYMKQIREAYFQIKDQDVSDDEGEIKQSYMRQNEITENGLRIQPYSQVSKMINKSEVHTRNLYK